MIRLRWSGLSGSVTRRTATPRSAASSGRVDVGHRLLDDVGEHALERGELEHLDVVLGDLAAHLDVELLGDLAGERGEDPAELLGQRDAGPDVLGDHAALDVDRVGDELAGQREPHRPGDRDAGLLLRLVGARRRGAGWRRRCSNSNSGLSVHGSLANTSSPAAGDAALLERDVERVLVDDAAAGRVDEDRVGLTWRSSSSPIRPSVSGVLGRCTDDEVGLLAAARRATTRRTPIWAARPACT